MFISISSFVIANDMVKEVQETFQNRPHLVDLARGLWDGSFLAPGKPA